MSDLDLVADYAQELAGRGGARAPATLGEIWRTSWDANALQTMSGSGRPLIDAQREMVEGVERVTGKSLAELYAERGVNPGSISTIEDQAKFLQGVTDELAPEQQNEIKPLLDPRKRAAARATATEQEAADTWGATYGLSGIATTYTAGLARQFIEPANILTAPLGGPLKGAILPAIGREFIIGAGTQALQEPKIQENRRELGLETGTGIVNIAEAGIGNALFALAGRGLASAYYRASKAVPLPGASRLEGFTFTGGIKERRGANETPGGPLNESSNSSPIEREDFQAAAMHAERNEVMDAAATPPTPAGRIRSAEKIDSAAAALEAGRVPDPEGVTAGPDLFDERGATPQFAEGFAPQRIAYFDGDVQHLIRPGGERLEVRPAVVELSDLTVSHNIDGKVNPNYPAELQPRDRSSAASRSWVAETAANLEPELLGRQPTARDGAPIVGPDGVMESGNGRAMLIARAYDRHPERGAAYRRFLEQQGYDLEGFKHPVLVRIRQGEVADRAAFAREANVSATAGMSAGERAFADAKSLDGALMQGYRGGSVTDARNVAFVRSFADRVVAPEERPQFVSPDDRLSAEGARRVEAALVARAWGSPDVVAALYENPDPNSRAILGAFADTAPPASRLRAAIDEGRLPKDDDPTPALIAAYRLVDRARSVNLKVADILDQADLEHGTVPDDVRAAARLFFRDDAMRVAAGRDVVATRIEKAINRALDQENALGDLFGGKVSKEGILRAAKLAGEEADQQPFGFKGLAGVVRKEDLPRADYEQQWKTLKQAQPFDTLDEALKRAPAHQAQLRKDLDAAIEGWKFEGRIEDPGIKKDRARMEAKLADYSSVRDVTDIVRAGVVADTPEEVETLIARLGAIRRVVDEGWTQKGGYLDRKLMAVMDDGTLAEIQIWPQAIFDAKKAEGGALYKQRRALGNDTLPGDPRVTELRAQEAKIWQDAAAKLPPEWQAVYSAASGKRSGSEPNLSSSGPNASSAAASESGSPSSSIVTQFEGRQPVSDNTKPPAGVTTPSLPRNEKNLSDGATIPAKVGASLDPSKPVAKIGEEIHFTEWRDAGDGFQVREAINDNRQEIRTPEGDVIARGYDSNGKLYEEIEIGQNPLVPGAMANVTRRMHELATRGTQKPLGDPALAKDAERVLIEAGGDFEISIIDPETGNAMKISARQAIKEAEEDAAAARELKDCIDGGEA